VLRDFARSLQAADLALATRRRSQGELREPLSLRRHIEFFDDGIGDGRDFRQHLRATAATIGMAGNDGTEVPLKSGANFTPRLFSLITIEADFLRVFEPM
jgi:hypothetical protein